MRALPNDDGVEWGGPRPLPAEGGLVLRASGEEIAANWWSKRFLALLESFGLGSRLERGRAYARTGQVVELDVEPGIVVAKVQGSRFTPYKVRIRPEPFSERQWRRAEKAIATQASTLAHLLAGELPAEIEGVLASARLALLPSSYAELRASCTCPDEANPCKHLAACYYVLAEQFDADPFALFTLRGKTKEELLDALRARRGGRRPRGRPARPAAPADGAPEPAEELARFWRAGAELGELAVNPLASEVPDALLRQLGPTGLVLDGVDVVELLARAYPRLAAEAERRAFSE